LSRACPSVTDNTIGALRKNTRLVERVNDFRRRDGRLAGVDNLGFAVRPEVLGSPVGVECADDRRHLDVERAGNQPFRRRPSRRPRRSLVVAHLGHHLV
jgi:hypothetical protein